MIKSLKNIALYFALAALAPSTAGAAVTSGSNLSQAPNAGLCVLPASPFLSCTTAITGLPVASRADGGALAGTGGVVTSWSVRTGNSSVEHDVRLRLVRNNTGVGTGPIESLPKSAGVYTYAARLPVQANDMIGVDTLSVPELLSVPIVHATSGATLDYWTSPLADGETRAPTNDEASNLELLVNATIEPDVDGDGFGDETQDSCVVTMPLKESCPPMPAFIPPEPPETWISRKSPKGKIHRATVTFRFGSNQSGTFQCKLGRKPWTTCKSPKTYKNLREGWHPFRVRAFNGSEFDPSPAKRFFKIEL